MNIEIINNTYRISFISNEIKIYTGETITKKRRIEWILYNNEMNIISNIKINRQSRFYFSLKRDEDLLVEFQNQLFVIEFKGSIFKGY